MAEMTALTFTFERKKAMRDPLIWIGAFFSARLLMWRLNRYIHLEQPRG